MNKANLNSPIAQMTQGSLAAQAPNLHKGFDITKLDNIDPEIIEHIINNNDLTGLGPKQRSSYIRMLCDSLGLNPLSKPLQLVEFKDKDGNDGAKKTKLSVYATKECAEQLRKIHGVSVTNITREVFDGMLIATAYVSDKYGRSDVSTGALEYPTQVYLKPNAIMKVETKAKRRATLSICGLGFLDESQLEDLTDPKPIDVPLVEESAVETKPSPEGTKEATQQHEIKNDAATFAQACKEAEGAKTKAELTAIKSKYEGVFTEPNKEALKKVLNKQLEVIRRAKVQADTEPAPEPEKPTPGKGLFAKKAA